LHAKHKDLTSGLPRHWRLYQVAVSSLAGGLKSGTSGIIFTTLGIGKGQDEMRSVEKNLGTERYRRKVLIPLSVTLILFTLLFVFVGDRFLQTHLDDSLAKRLATVEILFPTLINQRSELMAATLTQIARDKRLQSFFETGNRAGLLHRAEKIFKPLHSRYNITHFYFHTLKKINYLRVHQPQRFGDLINRYTLNEAAATGRISSGIELGPLGTFTLRTVLPWNTDDRRLGYLELGEEIDPIIRTLREVGKAELLITIRKEFLNRQGWEEGMRMLGRPDDWNLFPNRVIIENTLPGLPAELVQIFSRAELPKRQSVDLTYRGRSYRGRTLPLRDAGNRGVGEILVLLDTTEQFKAFHHDMAWMVATLFILGGSLFVTAFSVLGRADRQLAHSRHSLKAQIEDTQRAKENLEVEVGQRRRAEQSLRRARDELEQRVIERTDQLKEAVTEARRGRDRIDGVLHSVTDILFVTDEQNRILTMNRAAEELLDAKLDEITGLDVDAVIKDAQLLQQVRAAIAARETSSFDLEVPEPDSQSVRIIQIRTSPVGSEERFGGMVFLGHDVTHDRQLDRLKSEFISTAAHELRTPMASILGFTELLREEGGFTLEEKKEFLSVIYEKADYLSGLLDDLLDVSRIESGKPLEMHPSPQTVKELIEPSVHHYQRAFEIHTIVTQLAEPELKLLADKNRISQVMENLLSNAVKYSPEGGTVKVTGRRVSTNAYQISIEDQGIGMTQEQISRVFEKFYRADAGSAIKGTGLGMTIVKAIVEAHDGRVWVESERGKGTTTCFTLPVA
jgi:PAS domain S-box-containing protein